MIKPEGPRWPLAVVLLHWTTAALVLATAGYGIYLLSPPDWSGPYIERYEAGIGLHKLGGLAVFVLALGWAAVRMRTPRPALTGGAAMRRFVRVVHGVLFALILLLPLSGYGMESFGGHGIDLPIGLSIPPLFNRNDRLSMILSYPHKWGAYLLLALVAVHVTGAVRRGLRPGDGTIAAMLPRLRARR